MDRVILAGLVMVASTAISTAFTPLARVAGRRFGIMDQPGDRKVHAVAKPRTGGWAVLAAFFAIVIAGSIGAPTLQAFAWLQSQIGGGLALLREAPKVESKLVALFGGSLVAFAVGLADDIFGKRFPVLLKAGGQIFAAAILVASDVKTSFLPYDWMNVVFSVAWIFGITNAFNLLDNMDGLSAGVALIACGVLLVNAWSLDEYFVSLILLAFMGSLLGFLLFNFHPSSIFLGDCGSHFIGYVMASLTLLERYVSHASGTLFPVLMPVLVLAVPLVDTATVVITRLREGRPFYIGDSRHLSHRLVEVGFSQRGAVLFLYLTTFSLGIGAVSLSDASLFQALLVLAQSVGFVVLTLLLMFVRSRARTNEAP